MAKHVLKEDIKASEGSDEGEASRLGPTPEGARSARAIAVGVLFGAILWALVAAAIFLIF
ncbi:MAG: hypothetical protein H0W74_12755 [Sphingosinicella sp.]|nr:hypothetical protein [Sphingosinicella sp.]